MGLSGGLVAWGVLCFLVTLAFTAWLLRHFSRPKTPVAISVIVYVAWLVAFSICFLIPLDLNADASDSLEVIWTILFWLGFVCTWMLLPMIQEYYDNGGFTFKHKLLLACRQNGILVLIAGTLVIALIIYLKAAKGMETSAIGATLKVLSNTFGLVLLCLLAGYGLVEVPRTLYYASNRERRRDFVYYTASTTHHEAEDTRDEFLLLCRLIAIVDRKVQAAHDATLIGYMAEVKATAKDKEEELTAMQYRPHPCKLKIHDKMKDMERFDTRDIIALNHQVRKCVRHLWLVDQLWSDTVDEGFAMEAELDESNVSGTDTVNAPEEQGSDLASQLMSRLPRPSAERMIWWRRRVRPRFLLVSSIVLGLLSVLLLWSELTIVFQLASGTELSPFHYMIDGLQSVAVLQQLFTLGLILYLFVCTAYTVFNVRVSSLYYCGPHHTDTNSLVYNATVLLRVSIALAYNFSMLLGIQPESLQALIGAMEEIPFFGGSFNRIFPVVMAIWAALIAGHAITQLMRCMDMQRFQFIAASAANTGEMSDAALETKSQIAEGQGLIKQEKRRRDRALESGELYTPHISGPTSPSASPLPFGDGRSASLSPSSQPGGASGYRGKILSGKEIRSSVRGSSSTGSLSSARETLQDDGSSYNPYSSSSRNSRAELSDGTPTGSSSGNGFMGKAASKYKGYGRRKDDDERKGFLGEE